VDPVRHAAVTRAERRVTGISIKEYLVRETAKLIEPTG
jgi:hypothetical protein